MVKPTDKFLGSALVTDEEKKELISFSKGRKPMNEKQKNEWFKKRYAGLNQDETQQNKSIEALENDYKLKKQKSKKNHKIKTKKQEKEKQFRLRGKKIFLTYSNVKKQYKRFKLKQIFLGT